MKRVIVVGGGASGMMAAISASEAGAEVILAEKNDLPGKKILSTGNGRCNFTNTKQSPSCYRGEDPDFAWGILKQFDWQNTVEYFRKAGIAAKDRNGYLYPASDQASSLRSVLVMELNRLGVQVQTGLCCKEIRPLRKGFEVMTQQKTRLRGDAVVLAAGSKAAPATGSDGSGYDLAKKLGHRLVPVLPALVQLRCKESFYKTISGVRTQAQVQLFADGAFLSSDTGELQLAAYGISGIPVFQVSRYASRALYEGKEVTAKLNFMPGYTARQMEEFLERRVQDRPQKKTEDFLTGLFPQKLAGLLLRMSHLDTRQAVKAMTEEQLAKLAILITEFTTKVIGTNSWESAQVCCGGIPAEEVNRHTLESQYVPGVYFAGEILDVDGICGGYNLQWAWSSGYVAGKEAAGR